MSNPTEAREPIKRGSAMTDLTERDEFIEQLRAFAALPSPGVMEFAPAMELHRIAGLALETIAAAWDQGAKWGAAEVTGDGKYETAAFLAPGDNPYREKPRPECICYGYGIDSRCNAHHDPFGVGNE